VLLSLDSSHEKDFQIPLHVDSPPPQLHFHLEKDSLFAQCAGVKLQSTFLNLQSHCQRAVDQMQHSDLVEDLIREADSFSLAASCKYLEKIPKISTQILRTRTCFGTY